jgi:hypothetical protein
LGCPESRTGRGRKKPTAVHTTIAFGTKSISTLGQKGRLPKCALKGSKHALKKF